MLYHDYVGDPEVDWKKIEEVVKKVIDMLEKEQILCPSRDPRFKEISTMKYWAGKFLNYGRDYVYRKMAFPWQNLEDVTIDNVIESFENGLDSLYPDKKPGDDFMFLADETLDMISRTWKKENE